jgi:hypothetical protein
VQRKRKIKKYLFGFKNQLQEEGKTPNTIQNYITTIRTFYQEFQIDYLRLEYELKATISPESMKKIILPDGSIALYLNTVSKWKIDEHIGERNQSQCGAY